MTTAKSQIVPLQTELGVQPSTDRTRLNTNHYTFCDKIRFWRGSPQKLGGWKSFTFVSSATIKGYARTFYSLVLKNKNASIIGTNTYLYSLYSQTLTNITPLETVTHAIANSISTDYGSLAGNPIATIEGSGDITVSDTNAAKYKAGDVYTLAGATTTNGILDTTINADHIINSIGTNEVILRTSGTATSTGNGGGASVVRATGLLTLVATAHGQLDGDRVKITNAATTGGVTADKINLEFIIRNKATDSFDIMTAGTATSSVTAGGGASTAYQKQIAGGNQDQSFGLGWGVGLWGVGLWGVSQVSSTGIAYPRIWSIDRFGDAIIASPGNQGCIYTWQGDTSVAPTLLTNAPTDVNYVFVSDNIVVTFGHQNIPNQIFASDQGDPTGWTASSLNQVYQDVIEGAGTLLSHVPVLGINLLFTSNQTYRFSKVDINAGVWQITLLDNSIGIISPMARVSVNNVAYWMARNNFYRWSGGNIEIMPANTQDQCTALNYVFNNINTTQLSKCFAWYNPSFNEVWFHYPSENSNECDRIIRVNLSDNSWCIDTNDRISAEYPFNVNGYPRLISSVGMLYDHEVGDDDDGSPMLWTLTTNLKTASKNTMLVPGLVPDSSQTGNISVRYRGYAFPQSSSTSFEETYTVTPTTERVATQVSGRFWDYTFSGNSLGQTWNMGQWFEYIQTGAPN